VRGFPPGTCATVSAWRKRFVYGWIVRGQLRQIDLFFVVFRNQFEALFQNCHHSEAEQVHFTIPMSAQSSLSHCTTTRPGIVAGSSGTTESSCPWQITMPPNAGPGAVANPASRFAQFPIFPHAVMLQIETACWK